MDSVKFPILSGLTREIWNSCAEQDLFVYASYIPSAQNIETYIEFCVILGEMK